MVALRGDLDIGDHFQPLHFKFCLVTHPSSLLLRGDEEDDDDYDDYAADDDGDDGDNFDNYGLQFADKYGGVDHENDDNDDLLLDTLSLIISQIHTH